MVDLSLSQARRVALAAQGFAERRPQGRPTRRHLRRVVDRIGQLQIDSVNVLVRSHYLPLFSRLGGYEPDLLDTATYRHRELFEYWGHAASLLPVVAHPLLRWRMARYESAGYPRLAERRPGFVEHVYEEVVARGPLPASALTDPGERAGPWWGWGDGKLALEWLLWAGRLAVADRRSFERWYDLTERVLPAEVLAAPTPSDEDAHRELLATAATALGVATLPDIADYFRIKVPEARPRLAELVEAGRLERGSVEGWSQPAYVASGGRVPRRVDASALLSPFDSLVWERGRVERLFDFRYRLEIYTPAPKRTYGYYVLPFLLGERLVARVDLKADRRAGALLALGVFAEAGVDHGPVAAALSSELGAMAAWLGVDRVEVADRGDLAPALRRTGRGGRLPAAAPS